MTRIESKIYAALAADDGGGIDLAHIAALYAQAHSSPYNVYSRIQWELLDQAIQKKRGKRGLDYVRREALRSQ